MAEKILVGLSGGVDSSVAAFILKSHGFLCHCCTMRLLDCVTKNYNVEQEKKAKEVSKRLNLKFSVFNFSKEFEENVVKPFVKEYENGSTPNPCIFCNRFLKFGSLLNLAVSLGFDKIATGHYAKVEYDEARGRWLLKAADSLQKDQSYFLYFLTQAQLSRIIFPLGSLTKPKVRLIAKENGLLTFEEKESQDICFVKDDSYGNFIEKYSGHCFMEGNFVDCSGKVLGRHKGIAHYTIGQRKGLGLSLKAPMYVKKIDCLKNEVVLAEKSNIYEKKVIVEDFNLIMFENLKKPLRVKAKVRYRQDAQWAVVSKIDENRVLIEFEQPQAAVCKGQAAVIYLEDCVVGGGIIV